LAEVLRSGLGLFDNVVVHELAVSDREGVAEIRVPRNDIGYSTIERNNSFEGKADLSLGVECTSVSLQRLDNLEIGPVGFIKVDVEGHELEVLEGARQLLERDHPNLIIEIEERHRPGAVAAACKMLGAMGYRAHHFSGDALVAVDPSTSSGQRNWVFVHEDNVAALHCI
jgi:FkbM family methyltransferase